VLRWMPPLIVSAAEIDRGVAAFAAALKATA
jgi:4-aminobutyrate aminotransferase-like enzyme